jgi:octaprenyl-diphosphate synthase
MQLLRHTQIPTRKQFTAFKLIENELSLVKTLINRQLTDSSGPAGQLVEKLNISGGKMLRPGLVLLSYRAINDKAGKFSMQYLDTDILLRTAAIVEMIHIATLLHDDVIDEGKKRRGTPTINSLYGNESAVLLGDFLLSNVFKMCANLKEQIIDTIATATARLCKGELRQLSVRRQEWELEELEYIDIITEKSAVFFSACCYLGALLAGATEKQLRLLSDFGLNIGIAFQIADDLLDITGDENKTGKTLGSDIYKNKPTLALIHLLKTIDRAQKNSLIEKLNTNTEDKKELAKLLDRYGSFKYARRCAEGYIAKAKELLAGLNESDARNALTETAQFVVSRAN